MRAFFSRLRFSCSSLWAFRFFSGDCPSASAASFTPWSTMRANCENALSTDRHIFWKSLADMPGMGLPEGPADQEPVPDAPDAGALP